MPMNTASLLEAVDEAYVGLFSREWSWEEIRRPVLAGLGIQLHYRRTAHVRKLEHFGKTISGSPAIRSAIRSL